MSAAKLKAKELIERFEFLYVEPMYLLSARAHAKECALLAVSEIYSALYNYLKDTNELQNADREFAYWKEVEKEIHNY